MNKLLEIKDKAVKFCGEYEHFILPVVRFAVAFIAFITIRFEYRLYGVKSARCLWHCF